MRTSIALIGFMGTGKTAVGRALAARLGKEFIEMDDLIEKQAGKTIPEIFTEDGEIRFRELEIEVTRQVAGRKNTVIACGGGVVLNRINIDRLKAECVLVLLTASPTAIFKRVSSQLNSRPLLSTPSLESIKGLMNLRKPFYDRAADITINTSRLSVDDVVNSIVEKLK